jgi:hypothetical protein
MTVKQKVGKRFASSVVRVARNLEKPKGYSVPLDPDVVTSMKQQSEASSVPVVRIVNTALRESMKPVAVGWATEGGKILYDRPLQWRVFAGAERHYIWKIGKVFTINGARDGRPEFDSVEEAVASLG